MRGGEVGISIHVEEVDGGHQREEVQEVWEPEELLEPSMDIDGQQGEWFGKYVPEWS